MDSHAATASPSLGPLARRCSAQKDLDAATDDDESDGDEQQQEQQGQAQQGEQAGSRRRGRQDQEQSPRDVNAAKSSNDRGKREDAAREGGYNRERLHARFAPLTRTVEDDRGYSIGGEDSHGGMPPLELPERGSQQMMPLSESPSKSRLLIRGASSFNMHAATLGELTVGTNTGDAQLRALYDVDTVMQEVALLEGEAERRVGIALLDAIEVLDASSWGRSHVSDVRYVCEELLPLCAGIDHLPASLGSLEAFVSARVVLELVNFVVVELLKQLEELSGHLAFWEDLEDSPMRVQIVLMWQRPRKWRGLARSIRYLDDLSLKQLGQLGRLKELALQFEDLRSQRGVAHLTLASMYEIASALEVQESASSVAGSMTSEASGGVARFWPVFCSAFDALEQVFGQRLDGLKQVPRHIKYWPEVMAVSALALGVGAFAVSRWDATLASAGRVADSMHEFFVEHVVKPTATLVDELIFDRMLQVSDAEAMADAQASLGRMLEDYVRESDPSLAASERARIVRELDVSVLSLRYETEMKKPFASLVSGDLVRMLLIQMQHLKKELLGIMSTLDELMRENQFNLQVLALMPSLVLAASVQQFGSQVLFALRGTKRSRRFVYAETRARLRDVEQTLNLHLEDQNTLKDVALGRLVLQVHLLENLLFSNQAYFDRHERRRLAEDVGELLSDQLSIAQKLNTIHRMHRSYECLASAAVASPFSLRAKLARFLL
ncbi:Nuclear control of ATPase protein 2 [Hondaea fermentalgiana]|uniref:Nuclear control of ATPase protein 2 n=1 Tax=Hondaea fermentalgiana TaxID=2315210 RepID=A0A2R5GSW4_9STRA|nr:Nuclear control of ATPase protein 2 [Hondaea fermentalgiana]|eukprot:GBG33966.1 Nuclear control of ATPase protein 2 [Hondaea fermentalgiana]